MKPLQYVLILVVPMFLFAGCTGPSFTQPTRPSVENASVESENYTHAMQVGQAAILVEVVNTDATRTLGLSGREQLQDGQGMLFDFSNTQTSRPSFWMKDMNFDIDIIWIASGKVVGITPNVPAPQNSQTLPTYSPPTDISHVLEVPSGYSERVGIKIGDAVKI
jgi:uncharacterized membrane protein (UPF0127 family)